MEKKGRKTQKKQATKTDIKKYRIALHKWLKVVLNEIEDVKKPVADLDARLKVVEQWMNVDHDKGKAKVTKRVSGLEKTVKLIKEKLESSE